MPTAHIVGIVIFDEKLFVGKGAVNKWMVKLTAGMHVAMVAEAPKRTGRMAATIDSEVRHIGTHQITGVVGPTVPYAGYVLRGTGFPMKGSEGSIYTNAGFRNRERENLGYQTLWGRIDPKTHKFTRTGKGKRARHDVRQKGEWLHLKPDGPYKVQVSGQKPNNFILKAYRIVRRRHRSLPLAPLGVREP